MWVHWNLPPSAEKGIFTMSSLAKPSLQLVIDLINADNGTSFAYNELVLSPPTENAITNNNRNTLTNVTSSDAFQFSGSENVYYNRLDFGILFQGLTITLGGQGCGDISGLLPELNATYGLGLTMADLVPQNFPAVPVWPLSLTIAAGPNSYAYIGQFTVVVQNTPAQLGDNLTDTILGNIGSWSYPLQTAVLDINTLSASMIKMNLERYKKNNFLRALAEDVKNNSMSDIQQSLDISNLFDVTRSLRADLTTGLNSNAATAALQVEVNALQTQVTTLQTAQSGLSTLLTAAQASIATNTTNVATMQGQITNLQTQTAALTTASTTATSSINQLSGQMTAVENTQTSLQTQLTTVVSTQSAHTSEINNINTQLASAGVPVRQTITLDAPAGGAPVQGNVAIANLFALLQIQTTSPVRVRLYGTAADRNADASRSVLADPPPGDGCTFEGTTTISLLGWNCSPIALVANQDNPITGQIYYTLEPHTTADATITLTYLVFEK